MDCVGVCWVFVGCCRFLVGDCCSVGDGGLFCFSYVCVVLWGWCVCFLSWVGWLGLLMVVFGWGWWSLIWFGGVGVVDWNWCGCWFLVVLVLLFLGVVWFWLFGVCWWCFLFLGVGCWYRVVCWVLVCWCVFLVSWGWVVVGWCCCGSDWWWSFWFVFVLSWRVVLGCWLGGWRFCCGWYWWLG